VYGPVRTVVWQGSAGDCGPYADQVDLSVRIRRRSPQVGFAHSKARYGQRFGQASASAAAATSRSIGAELGNKPPPRDTSGTIS